MLWISYFVIMVGDLSEMWHFKITAKSLQSNLVLTLLNFTYENE